MDRLNVKNWLANLKTSLQQKPALFRLIKASALVGIITFVLFVMPLILQRIVVSAAVYHPKHIALKDSVAMSEERILLENNIKQLNKRLNAFIPSNHYLIINSTDNVFMLYKGKTLIREGICSTGSYLLLENDKQQSWLFKTPKGEFKILNKKVDPVWKKPDWAFIEEGLPVPSPNHPSRFEYGVLGDYSMSLGDGYMIHGTLWQRYLGLPVTHGCVRMNDADLEAVYKTLSVGSKVYIY